MNRKVVIFVIGYLLILIGCIVWSRAAIVEVPEAEGRMNLMIVGGGAGEATTTTTIDYSDIIFFWTCESATLGANDCYGADSTARADNAASISSTEARIGTNSCYFNAGSSQYSDYNIDITSNDIYSPTEGRVGFWVWFDSAVTTDHTTMILFQGTGQESYIRTNAADATAVYVRYHTSVYANDNISLSNPVSIGDDPDTFQTWYFVEYGWDSAAEVQQVWINGVSQGTVNATIGDELVATYISIGLQGGDADMYIDNIIITDDFDRDLCGTDGACDGIAVMTSCPN